MAVSWTERIETKCQWRTRTFLPLIYLWSQNWTNGNEFCGSGPEELSQGNFMFCSGTISQKESHTETIHTHIHTRGLFSVNDLPTHKSNFFFLQKSQLNFHCCWNNKVTTRPNVFFFQRWCCWIRTNMKQTSTVKMKLAHVIQE